MDISLTSNDSLSSSSTGASTTVASTYVPPDVPPDDKSWLAYLQAGLIGNVVKLLSITEAFSKDAGKMVSPLWFDARDWKETLLTFVTVLPSFVQIPAR
jgi:hypothetical protein